MIEFSRFPGVASRWNVLYESKFAFIAHILAAKTAIFSLH